MKSTRALNNFLFLSSPYKSSFSILHGCAYFCENIGGDGDTDTEGAQLYCELSQRLPSQEKAARRESGLFSYKLIKYGKGKHGKIWDTKAAFLFP